MENQGAGLTDKLFAVAKNHLFNNIAAFVNLILCNKQWRRKPDDVAVRRFGQQSVAGEIHTKVPCRFTLRSVVDNDNISLGA